MMSEADLDELLQIVCNEIALDTELTSRHRPQPVVPDAPPIAANDNADEWPLVPFPDGWIASC